MFDHPSILQRPRLSMILYGETCRSGLLKVRKNVLSSCFGVVLKASWSVWVAAILRKGQTTDTVFPRWGGRGYVVFAQFPNQSTYQIQSNDVLKRHDPIIEAATEMAGESDLAQAILYCNKPWKKADPRPSSSSEGGLQRRGLHFSRQMLSTAVPTKLKLRTGQGSKT